MKENDKNKLRVVVGLGKTGLSCLRYLDAQGYKVAAIDSREQPPAFSEEVQKEFAHISIHLGDFKAPFLSEAYELVVSPGVALATPEIAEAIKGGTKVAGDIELFVRDAKAPIIAITGSNGKSTVTTLVGEMVNGAGFKGLAGGNLGTPALDLLVKPVPDFYVLELSSFQLETTSSLKAKAVTVLNISEDHLDRYPTMDDYIKTKQKIYEDAEWIIVNRDDPVTHQNVVFKDKSKVITFGLKEPQSDEEFGLIDEHLALGKKKLMPISEMKVKGYHQAANALACLAFGKAIGLSMEAMLKTLREFGGLRHRCAYIATINGVDYYNDSKGTNVGATYAAIFGVGSAIKGDIILIAGGLGKGADFSPLKEVTEKYVSKIILIGRDAPIIEKALSDNAECLHAGPLEEALLLAKANAKEGDVVLLSPACASFDMFQNFMKRGEDFEELVLKLKEEENASSSRK